MSAIAEEPRLRPVRMGSMRAEMRAGDGGVMYLRSLEPLGPYPRTMTDRLREWAERTPDAVFLADRGGDGAWRRVTYSQVWQQVRGLGQVLLDAGLSAERPLMILSGNEIEHALLGYAAMLVGVPHAPVSPNYSLVSRDYAKLQHAAELLNPGLVYASDGAKFRKAAATVLADARLIVAGDVAALAATPVTDAVDRANATVGPDTVAKLLFTSGSTGMPKAVITTQRMLCANQEQIRTALAFLQDEPPVLCDWSPWNHTAGGSHNLGIALYNGGTLYIDDGLPTPEGIGRTVRSLEEVSPTLFFNVPKGYEMLIPHLETNPRLRQSLFRRLKLMQYAGAGLSQYAWDGIARASIAATGERVMMITGYGSTETAPFAFTTTWHVERAGQIGLPAAGMDVKLVPNDEKIELRLKGPNVTPGYWKRPEETGQAFDEEGYYKIGDAVTFAEPGDISRGLIFDGRVTEDFKLSTGTWVNMAAVRSAVIAACAPLIRDVVLTGLNRGHIGALIFPDPGARTGLDLEAEFGERLRRLALGATGSSNHVARAIILRTPPQIDAHEVTDKGSINQRAVMAARAAEVEDLYAEPPPSHVLVFPRSRQ